MFYRPERRRGTYGKRALSAPTNFCKTLVRDRVGGGVALERPVSPHPRGRFNDIDPPRVVQRARSVADRNNTGARPR